MRVPARGRRAAGPVVGVGDQWPLGHDRRARRAPTTDPRCGRARGGRRSRPRARDDRFGSARAARRRRRVPRPGRAFGRRTAPVASPASASRENRTARPRAHGPRFASRWPASRWRGDRRSFASARSTIRPSRDAPSRWRRPRRASRRRVSRRGPGRRPPPVAPAGRMWEVPSSPKSRTASHGIPGRSAGPRAQSPLEMLIDALREAAPPTQVEVKGLGEGVPRLVCASSNVAGRLPAADPVSGTSPRRRPRRGPRSETRPTRPWGSVPTAR